MSKLEFGVLLRWTLHVEFELAGLPLFASSILTQDCIAVVVVVIFSGTVHRSAMAGSSTWERISARTCVGPEMPLRSGRKRKQSDLKTALQHG